MNIYQAYFHETGKKTTYVHHADYDPEHLKAVLRHFLDYEIEDSENYAIIEAVGASGFLDKDNKDIEALDFSTVQHMNLVWIKGKTYTNVAIFRHNGRDGSLRDRKTCQKSKSCKRIIVFEAEIVPPRVKERKHYDR